MADYKKMYYKMFNKVTDIIEDLKQLQTETEEICMETADVETEDEVEEMES